MTHSHLHSSDVMVQLTHLQTIIKYLADHHLPPYFMIMTGQCTIIPIYISGVAKRFWCSLFCERKKITQSQLDREFCWLMWLINTFSTHYCSTGATLGCDSVEVCKRHIILVVDFSLNYIILCGINIY